MFSHISKALLIYVRRLVLCEHFYLLSTYDRAYNRNRLVKIVVLVLFYVGIASICKAMTSGYFIIN